MSHPGLPDAEREVKFLREQTLDQEEQIQVLVAEIERLRIGSMSDIERRAKEESFHKIRNEEVNSNKEPRSNSDPDDESGSFSAPFSEYEFLTLSEAKRLLDQKDILIAKYEEKSEKVFEVNRALTTQIEKFKTENIALNSKCESLEQVASDISKNVNNLTQENTVLMSDCLELQSKLSLLESKLMVVTNENDSLRDFQNDMNAHHWWEFVYLEFQKREKIQKDSTFISEPPLKYSSATISNKENCNANNTNPSLNTTPTVLTNIQFELSVHEYEALKSYPQLVTNIANTNNNLILQATEITNLRQELLSRKMQFHRQLADARLGSEGKDREIMKLTKMYQNVKMTNDIKLNELSMTIKSMSSRSDLHAQIVAARSELEVEKLSAFHLRDDIDTYRTLLLVEQKKVDALRQENAELTSAIESGEVLNTYNNIHGVKATTLMEVLSGHYTVMEKELSNTKAMLRNITEKFAKLQKLKSSISTDNNSRTKVADSNRLSGLLDAETPRSQLSRPAGRFSVNSVGASIDSIATSDLNPLRNASVVSLNTEEQTLHSINEAILQQEITARDEIIQQLQAQFSLLQTKLVSQESQSGVISDNIFAAVTNDSNGVSQNSSNSHEFDQKFDNMRHKLDHLTNQISQKNFEIEELKRHTRSLEESVNELSYQKLLAAPASQQTAPHVGVIEANISSSALNFPSTNSVDVHQLQLDYEQTKHMLNERTSQLKILMDTFDAVQLSGLGLSINISDSSSRGVGRSQQQSPSSISQQISGSGNSVGSKLNQLAQTALPLMESTWGIQALVKRVVEVTAEMASQSAELAIEQRRANQLERENQRKAHSINELKRMVKDSGESLNQQRAQLETLQTALRDADRVRQDMTQSLTSEVNELATKASDLEELNRELQYQLKDSLSSTVAPSNPGRGIEFTASDGDKQWLENIILSDSLAETTNLKHLQQQLYFGESNDVVEAEDEIKALLTSLLVQFKGDSDDVNRNSSSGAVPSRVHSQEYGSSALLTTVHKMVTSIYSKYTDLRKKHNALKLTNIVDSSKVTILRSRLKSALNHLTSFKSRCDTFDTLLFTTKRQEQLVEESTNTILKRQLQSERIKCKQFHNKLVSESRELCLLKIAAKNDALKTRKLQAVIADYETSLVTGNSSVTSVHNPSAILQAREEALQLCSESIEKIEEKFYTYINLNLPRILSGLPVLESSLAEYPFENTRFPHETNTGKSSGSKTMGNLYGHTSASNGGTSLNQASDSVSSSHRLPITERATQELGLDRHFALAEALSHSQAVQTVLHMKINQLTEKNMILKERNYSLESIVSTWKREMDGIRVPNESTAPASIAEHQQSEINHLTEQILTLTTKLHQCEEDNITLKTISSNQEQKHHQFLQLYSQLQQQESQQKAQFSANIMKLRASLESEHCEELAALRNQYERERQLLYAEIESVAEDSGIDYSDLAVDADQPPEGGVQPSDVLIKPPQIGTKKTSLSLPPMSPAFTSGASAGSSRDKPNSRAVSQVAKKKNPVDSHYKAASPSHRSSRPSSPKVTNIAVNMDSPYHSRSLSDAEINNMQDVAQLQRQVRVEIQRNQQAQSMIDELENMVSVQTSAFKSAINHSEGITVTQNSDSNSDKVGTDSLLAISSMMDELGQILENSQRDLNCVQTAVAYSRRIQTSVRDLLLLINSNSASLKLTDMLPARMTAADATTIREQNRVESETESLRDKINSIESDFGQKRLMWENERNILKQNVAEYESKLDRLKTENTESMISLKRIYELSIKQLQEALDMQTRSAKDEIEKLKGRVEGQERKYARDFENYIVTEPVKLSLASSTPSQISTPSKQHRVKDSEKEKENYKDSDKTKPKKTKAATTKQASVNNSFTSSHIQISEVPQQQEIVDHLQSTLDDTIDELRKVKHELFMEREKHEGEMESVRDNFRQLRMAQEAAVQALESELQDVRFDRSSSHLHPHSFTSSLQLTRMLSDRGEENVTDASKSMSTTLQSLAERDKSTLQLLDELNRRWQSTTSGGLPQRKTCEEIRIDETQHSSRTYVQDGTMATLSGNALTSEINRDINVNKALTLERENASLVRMLENERLTNFELIQQIQSLQSKLSHSRLEGDLDVTSGGHYDKIESFQFDQSPKQASSVSKERQELSSSDTTHVQAGALSDKMLSALTNKIARAISAAEHCIKKINSYEYATLFQSINHTNASVHGNRHQQDVSIDANQSDTIYNIFNEVRNISVKELNKLKHLLIASQKFAFNQRTSVAELQSLESELRVQIQQLKEEIARKAKHVASLKQTKDADTLSMEKLRNEKCETEESLKRTQKALTVKENLVKDLRGRIETLELDLKTTTEKTSDSVDVLSAHVEVTDLQNRLAVTESEKFRYKSRAAALKDQSVRLEESIRVLQAEIARLSMQQQQFENLKVALSRKETLAKNLRETSDKSKSTFEQMKATYDTKLRDAEKKMKSYLKQIEILERNGDTQNRELLESNRELMHWKDVAHSRISSSVSYTPMTPGGATPFNRSNSSGKLQVQNVPLSQVMRTGNNTPLRDRTLGVNDASSFANTALFKSTDDNRETGVNATQQIQDATKDLKEIMLALGLGQSK